MARKKKVVEEVNEVNKIKEEIVETTEDVIEAPVEEKIEEVEEVKEEISTEPKVEEAKKVKEAPKKAEKDEVRLTSLAEFLF